MVCIVRSCCTCCIIRSIYSLTVLEYFDQIEEFNKFTLVNIFTASKLISGDRWFLLSERGDVSNSPYKN